MTASNARPAGERTGNEGYCVNDEDPLWTDLDALDRANDLDGALALGETSALGRDPRYARYIAWAFAQRQDFLSAGKWYAKAYGFGAHEAESEFQTCLRELYASGRRHQAAELAGTPPMDDREGTHRTMLSLHFEAHNSDGMLNCSLRLADGGRPYDVRYAGEVLLSRGDAETAFTYMKRATEDGDSLASQLLGEMYLQGVGTPRNEELAESAYQAPARDGLILSRSRLAHLAHRRVGNRFDIAFVSAMTAILVQAAWLRLFRPSDTRLRDLPKGWCNERKNAHDHDR
jgi:TPR repeat protein